jgi:hypothetical protein
MTIHIYKCKVCGHEHGFRDAWTKREWCPKCNKAAAMRGESSPPDSMFPTGRTTEIESGLGGASLNYKREMVSNALAVHPKQIPQMKERFPHHRFNDKGQMLIGSGPEFNRVLKDIGFADKNPSGGRKPEGRVFFTPR